MSRESEEGKASQDADSVGRMDVSEEPAPPCDNKPVNLDAVSWFSRFISYTFATPLISEAADRGLVVEMEHLWRCPESENVEVLIRRFDEERARDPDRNGYYRPVISVGSGLVAGGAFCVFVKTICEVCIPLFVRVIIQRIEQRKFDGLYYVLGLLLLNITGQLCNQLHLRCMEVATNRMRAASNYAIFRHALKLRACSFGSGLSDVVTLVASDTQRFIDVHPHFHLIWASPVQIILGTAFMVQFVSYSGLLAVGIMLLLYPYSFVISRLQSGVRQKLLPLTQQRVRQISEYLQGVRVVKMYGWEPFLLSVIEKTRAAELSCLFKELMLWIASTSFLIAIPPVALCITFTLYINTEGALSAADTFAALSMLTLLKFPVMYFGTAIMIGLQTKVGCDRIRAFLQKDNLYSAEGAQCTSPLDDTLDAPSCGSPLEEDAEAPMDEAILSLNNCDFAWTVEEARRTLARTAAREEGRQSEPFDDEDDCDRGREPQEVAIFELRGLTLKLRRGECVAIMGAVGSGKSMAIMSLLQETFLTSGALQTRRKIAYAAQEPFLMSGTIRENIVFHRPFDEDRYRLVLSACQLWADLEQYADGELTIVGERGVTLSGGQKARIALARAVYSTDTDLVVLDDVFSALDASTGKMVLEALLLRPHGLLRQQAVVLVTHARGNLWAADHLVEMAAGNVSLSPSSPSADACYDDGSVEAAGTQPSPTGGGAASAAAAGGPSTVLSAGTKNKLVEAEYKQGTVAFRTYYDFFKNGGGMLFVAATVLGICCERVSFVSGDTWLSIWSSAENGKPTHTIGQRFDFPEGNNFDGAAFYLKVYAVIVSLTYFLAAARLGVFAIGGATAAKNLFSRSFTKLTRCPMEFFDSTPTGRILNRMSHDVERVGYPLITQLNATFATSAWMLSGLAVAAAVVPYSLLALVPAIVTMFYFLLRFRAVNVHLQRLDAIARSSLQSHIFESVTGAPTIRAFNASGKFLHQCRALIDSNTQSLFAVAMCQRWVAIRAEVLAVTMTFSVTFFVWLLRHDLAGGVAGMAIVWGMNIARSITFAVTEGVQGEAKLVSVERLVDYIESLPEEPARIIPGSQPPLDWPRHGKIEFQSVCMRYREGLPLVLNNCTFTVQPGTRVGLVGRTGSGKSSTIVALFRLRELVSGSIVIDGVDLSQTGLDAVRGGSICIVPQDPVLFSGDVRSNVDPFVQFSDEKVVEALKAVLLWDYVETIGGLHALIEERGRNLSVGQRQLLCIARALLRSPKILLMDEAVANVDDLSDKMIQRAVRSLFRDATVVEIAHRLHTVMDADKVIVMSDGAVAQAGAPHQLCQSEGLFSSMVDATGLETASELRELAKATYEARVSP